MHLFKLLQGFPRNQISCENGKGCQVGDWFACELVELQFDLCIQLTIMLIKGSAQCVQLEQIFICIYLFSQYFNLVANTIILHLSFTRHRSSFITDPALVF